MNIKNKRITVIGLGISGTSSAILANYLGAIVFVSENKSNDSIHKNASKLMNEFHIASETGIHTKKIYEASIWIISPGLSKNSKIIKKAKNKKIKILGEIEFASLFTSIPIVAITGSNGKTTTTNILNNMLNTKNINPILAGNLGIPFSEKVLSELKYPIKKKSIYVLEISSFQLEMVYTFKPKYAIYTNISSDHMNRHLSMEEYIKMKLQLIKNMDTNDFIIYNQDDPILKKSFKNHQSKKIPYSIKNSNNIFSIKNNYLQNNKNKTIISINEFSIPGEHNISNFIAAATCAKIIGINELKILETIKTFPGLEHRLEYVLSINNIKFINDSKATNIESVIVAIKSIKRKIILILGGQNKGSDFRLLLPQIKANKIKLVISYGESGGHINTVLGDAVRSQLVNDLNSAVKIAHNLAAAGDTILLSPGCASFDQFSNFEERGKLFKEYVKNINLS